MKSIFLALVMSFSMISCNTTVSTGGYYNPTPYYTCDYIWDTWSGDFIYACYWVYYSEDGSEQMELDMSADMANIEENVLNKNAEYYADTFSLSTDKALKIAKHVRDINLLEERTGADIADFAEKLYGINTVDAISAAGKAQLGDHGELDLIIEKAAKNFNTDSENMKSLLKEIHGKALEANGINL